MVRYLFYTIGDLTYQSPLVLLRFHGNSGYSNALQYNVVHTLSVFFFNKSLKV